MKERVIEHLKQALISLEKAEAVCLDDGGNSEADQTIPADQRSEVYDIQDALETLLEEMEEK